MKRIRLASITTILGMLLIPCAVSIAASVFTVTYDGNGNTGGAVPVDGTKY